MLLKKYIFYLEVTHIVPPLQRLHIYGVYILIRVYCENDTSSTEHRVFTVRTIQAVLNTGCLL